MCITREIQKFKIKLQQKKIYIVDEDFIFVLYACRQCTSRLLYMSSDSRRAEEEKKKKKKKTRKRERRKNGVCWDSRLFEKHLVASEGERKKKREKRTNE